MKKYALWATLLLLSRVCAADFNTGVAAYSKGDYSTALKEWLAVAEQKEGSGVNADFEWHSYIAENTVNAQYALGSLYWQGKGVKQNYKIAEKWLLLAANSGHSDAQEKLAYLYSSDFAGKKDYAIAKSWLEKAVAQNNPNAEYDLGVMYFHGLGVKADKQLAKTWLTRAKQHGDSSADELLAKISSSVTETKPIETVTPTPEPTPPPVAKTKPDDEKPAVIATEPAKKPSVEKVTSAVDKKSSSGHYTVQVFSSLNKNDVMRLKEQWHDTVKSLTIAEKNKNGKQFFILLYGNYSSESEAKQAINKLPAELRKHNPWLFKKTGR